MFRGLQPVKAPMNTLTSRRAMLDTLMRHLDMVRLSVGLAAVIALSACHGLISGSVAGGDGTSTPEEQAAITKWNMEALPVFQANCVACHTGQYPDQAFLTADNTADMRTALLAFNPSVVDLGDPAGSRVLVKGIHEGPALGSMDSESILDWINAEKDAEMVSNPIVVIETDQFLPQLCTSGNAGDPTCPINHVSLASLGLPGAEVDFVAQALSSDLYITDLYTVASVDGVYLEHPLFTSFPPAGSDGSTPDPIPDLLDRFYDVKLNLAAAATPVTCPPIGPSCDHIGAGASVFHDFSPTNPLTISFKVLSAYMSDSTPPPAATGCDTAGFASFQTNVVPLMNAVGACNTCHDNQNAGATSAMPLLKSDGTTGGLLSTTDNTACLAVRSHVNFQAISTSDVLLAPDPAGDGAHPFKLSTASTPTLANFQAGMTTWINVEASGM